MELHLLFFYAMAETARMCTSVHSDLKLQRRFFKFKNQAHTRISAHNFFHFTINLPLKVSWSAVFQSKWNKVLKKPTNLQK